MDRPPQILVIGGPNGAGKTTSAMKLLRRLPALQQFVNADEIARGLSPFAPETVALTAGKLMLQRIEELRSQRSDLAIESTLSGRTYAKLFESMRADGYRITLFYVWLSSAELSIHRIAERVHRGGHHIPTEVARRRYTLGIRNLLDLYLPLADDWWICDNSQAAIYDVAKGGRGLPTRIYHAESFRLIHEIARVAGEDD